MSNLRLCSAYTLGSTTSRGTRTMSRNCARHLAATIRVLAPTLCIVQGVEVGRHVAALTRHTAPVSPELRRGEIAGVPVLVATFTHPTAHADQRWGGLNGVPYLYGTVAPALRKARRLIADPDAQPLPPPSAPRVVSRPVRADMVPRCSPPPSPEPEPSRAVLTARMSTREIGLLARRTVRAEMERRGGRVTERQVGRRTELRVHTSTGRTVEVRVLSRRAGDWQTSIHEGDTVDADPDRFWILVDFAAAPPTFYVVPADWMSRDIRREHDEYLTRHGGQRAVTPDSTHHRIQTFRVSRWRERWDLVLP